jgi:5'-3' exonuclease
MGIPSYFSHIMKTYKICKTKNTTFDYLFLDCNSVIYEVIRRLTPTDLENRENIYQSICEDLDEIQRKWLAREKVMICFDGIAPFAKMKQQRERRFRSKIMKSSLSSFDTCAITPETTFMNHLSHYISRYFQQKTHVIVSGSNENGEGEHKIFHYIRGHMDEMKESSICIHGLDADLIILSLQHQHLCKSITLVRGSSGGGDTKLDIDILSDCIFNELSFHRDKHYKSRIVHDYVLLSFFLGNDFLPHSPLLNIRNKGIKHILHAYYQVLSSQGLFLTNEKREIEWSSLKKLITFLSSMEEEYMKEEHKHIMTPMKRHVKPEDRIPHREGEQFIQPYTKGWKTRYYKRLFRGPYKNQISIFYLKGLQWCLHYYNGIILDSHYAYPYAYAPLFSDIIHHIPDYNVDFFPYASSRKPIQPIHQLCYVIPPSSYYLLPKDARAFMEEYQKDINNIPLQWDYCSFLWESHPLLPPISINEIQKRIK